MNESLFELADSIAEIKSICNLLDVFDGNVSPPRFNRSEIGSIHVDL